MDSVNLIAFCGKKGSGKTTVAQTLSYRLAPCFSCQSFATPIKEMLFDLGLDYEQLHEQADKETVDTRFGKTPRQMAQSLGTEWGRQMVHPDIWVNQMARKIEYAHTPPEYGVLIDDLRFANEARMVKDKGGVIVHLTGSHTSQQEDTHVSEHLDDELMELVDIHLDGHRPPEEVVEELLEKLKTL